ncbi:MAG: peptidoglycan-binding domain-containing protein [Patescibacteria group bacterium]
MKKIFSFSLGFLVVLGLLVCTNFASAQNTTNQAPFFDQYTVQDVWFDSAVAANVDFQIPSAYTGADKVTPVNVTCDHTSGALFQPGRTVVTCTATNNDKTAEAFLRVWVRTGTTPIINLTYTSPSQIIDGRGGLEVTETSSGSGIAVNYTYDLNLKDYSGNNSVKADSISCTPASGSVFFSGITPITCTANKSAQSSGAQIIIQEQSGVVVVHAASGGTPSTGNCSDGIMNGDETGADTGGRCGSPSSNTCPSGYTGTYPNCTAPSNNSHVVVYGASGYSAIPLYNNNTNTVCPGQSMTIAPNGTVRCVTIVAVAKSCAVGQLFNTTNGLPCSGLTNTLNNTTLSLKVFVFQKKVGKLAIGTTAKAYAQEVLVLQQWLNIHGFILATTGAGSPGHETTVYAVRTKNAVMAFQRANPPLNVDGIFGPLTMGVINKILAKEGGLQ